MQKQVSYSSRFLIIKKRLAQSVSWRLGRPLINGQVVCPLSRGGRCQFACFVMVPIGRCLYSALEHYETSVIPLRRLAHLPEFRSKNTHYISLAPSGACDQ